MPVDGVSGSEGARVEQVRVERQKEDTRAEEQRRSDAGDRDVEQTRQVADEGRGGNMDVTV